MYRLLGSKFLTAAAIIVLIVVGTSLRTLEARKELVKKETQGLETKIELTKKNNEYLETTLSRLQEPAFLEREARSKFNYKAPGEEVVFVYTDAQGVRTSASSPFEAHLRSLPHYRKWWHYLIGTRNESTPEPSPRD